MSPPREGGQAGGGRGAELRLLPVSGLDLSLVTRVRAATSDEAIEDYATRLDSLPPVWVALVQGGRHVVVGGLHRVLAHERAGRVEVPCLIEAMALEEAVRAAAADNRAHGVRMTRADKRAAIGLLLAEEPELSSRAVAELVGCSHHTVEEVRAQVGDLPTSPASTGPTPGPAAPARRGRDGKTYRRAPGPRPASAPEVVVVPEAAEAAAAPGFPAPPVCSPALLTDFRAGVRWVARFISFALRSPRREHRAEALDELRETLAPEELRRLAAWAEEAAEARGADSRPSGAAA